ncbi:hypothetical protein JG687_00011236 [Phytophthora cactorum]|uniref:Uncharacterized protein n=1 Tax=Phytophthora cactorum TaxID=29920 RepID=A0A8T1U7G4_9STRA|nr:hypothetical protein JG687_00011236 [Phytophthora cactorum]
MKCMLGYHRKRMSAKTQEIILFLRLNWTLVTNEITSMAVWNARKEEVDNKEECYRVE